MLHEYLGVSTFILLGVGSAKLYEPDHRSRDYQRNRTGTIPSPRGFRAVYHWIRFSSIGLGIAALVSNHAVWLALPSDPGRTYAGSLIAVLGFLVFAAAKRTLGQHYSPCFDAYLPNSIVQSGPYRFVRHPIYSANLVTVFGLTLASGSLWLLLNLILLFAYYTYTARLEEDALVASLPGYRAYRKRTGRFLPGLG